MDLLRPYHVFVKLADTRHFARTAAQCNLSPSAVSRHLQRLEDSVGRQLVMRDNRRVELTAAGRRFLDHARKALADWQQLQGDLGAGARELGGEVSVFGSVTASYSMLTRILPLLRAGYPGIELKLRTGDQADGVQRVLAGSEDSAIIARPDPLPPRLAFQPLRETPLRLIGPRTPSALTEQIERWLAAGEPPDWQRTPMILAERGLARERLLGWLRSAGQAPNIYAQVAGHEAVVSMVSLGLGVAVVPELVIEHSPKQETIRVLPWITDLAPFELGLTALQERLRDPLLQAFWAAAGAAYPQPAAAGDDLAMSA